MRVRLVRLAMLCAAVMAFAMPLSAQTFTGRIDVTVADATGAILPGVTVEISGPQSAVAVTDAQGEAHFLNLTPGTYAVAAKLSGFGDYMNKNVPVLAGGGVPLKISLAVGGVSQVIEVTGESPLVDPRRMTTATNITAQELQEIPSARDPWVVLQTVPGIIVDRVNVGGAESGQQSNYQSKGSATGDNTWNLDGIAITDMAALGSSPTYFDFDMFQEMQVTTGGADLSMATGGVGLNMVLKSGSNTPRGSTRFYFENEDMQSNNLPDDLAALPGIGGTSGKGNRINEYMDYGGELGGPIWKDRLWAWGAYGKTDITLLTLANTPDQTILENSSLKLTGQATKNLRGNYTYYRGEKAKFGREAGLTRPPETTLDQESPTSLHKGELNLVVSDNLFLTGRGASVSNVFSLIPQGGLETPWYTDDDNVHHGSYQQSVFDRPSWTVQGDGNYFRGRHEIKFGTGYRKHEAYTKSAIPGYGGFSGIHTTHDVYPNMIADIWVPTSNAMVADYMHAFIGDTISFDKMTLNLGLRWDRQATGTMASTQQGFAEFSSLLPDLTSEAIDDAIVYKSWSPRVGVTYAFDAARKTIGRASYSAFADQLGGTAASFLSTVSARGLYVYDVVDQNGNQVVDPFEVGGTADCSDTGPRCYPYGFDISDPGATGGTPQHTIGDYKTPKTHEFQLGIDRELFPNFAVSGTFTYRHFANFNWRNNGLVSTDYEQTSTYTGTADVVGDFSVPVYGAIEENLPEFPSRTVFRTRPDYYQRYLGFELSATKRLSNRWMARFGFSTNQHTEYFDSAESFTDPTPAPTGRNESGQQVVRQSTGSGKSSIYQILPSYQFIATGLYQAGWGINLAANMVNRQGFAAPYFRSKLNVTDPLVAQKTVSIISENGEFRLPSVTSLDFRVGKEFAVRRARFNVDLDVFNVLNSATVLGREYDFQSASYNNVREIMNPRVLRLGLRMGF